MDDLLNSDAFLNKKVEMLQKQIKATQQDIVTAQAQADEQWAEWGPQVSRVTWLVGARFSCRRSWYQKLPVISLEFNGDRLVFDVSPFLRTGIEFYHLPTQAPFRRRFVALTPSPRSYRFMCLVIPLSTR